VLFGTWAEFILPALVVLGLFTRIAALGMIGFVIVLTWVDIMGHGAGPETIGAWFNNTSGDAILDQRAFWLFLLIVLVLRGGGPLSLDALVSRRYSSDDLHRRVPAEVKHPVARLDHRTFHQRGVRGEEIEGRLRPLCLRQTPPGRGPRVQHPVPEGPEEPRPRRVVQRRFADIHEHRFAPRVAQAPNRLSAGIAVAQPVDLDDVAHRVASFFNLLRKLAPSRPGTSD
jgi:hypothetical protein